jgi:CHAT domain-containing protein
VKVHIFERLAKADPGNAGWQRDLALSHGRVAMVLARQGSWEVYSDATVKLVTGAVREMARDPQVGRAEALRRSMLALIDKGAPHEAHPAYWAPFVLVGEGADGR